MAIANTKKALEIFTLPRKWHGRRQTC